MDASCAFVLEKAAAFCDDALSEAETAIIAQHLEQCPTCSQVYAQMDKLEIHPPKIRSNVMLFDDPTYWDKMDAELNEVMEENHAPSNWDKRHLILAAVAIFCFGWALFQQSQIAGLSIVVDNQQQELERMHQLFIQNSAENPGSLQKKSQKARYDL